ncbi:hypothetical protein ACFE04_009968 [Oxalis oulophora]
MTNPQSLIPGLPDEISELCLLNLPYPYQSLVRRVSSSWNKTVTDPTFLLLSKNSSQPYIFVLAHNKSTAKIQWQSLDLKSRRWFVLPPMMISTLINPSSFACVSLPRQGKLFVLGGIQSETDTSTNYGMVYTTSTDQWSKISPMLKARSFFTAEAINGKILAVGGCGPGINDAISAVESYDPETDTWTNIAKLQTNLARYDSATIGNKMYVTEGWTWPFMFSPRGGVYDAVLNTWDDMIDGMKEGWTGISVVINDRLFVISEHGDRLMKVYDPDDDTWRNVGGENFPCEAMQRPFCVSGVEGKIVVVSSGLHVAIGDVYESDIKNGEFCVQWEVVEAPKAFKEFDPCNCQVLYA